MPGLKLWWMRKPEGRIFSGERECEKSSLGDFANRLTPGPSPRIFLAEKSWRGVPKRWIFAENHLLLAPLSIVEAVIERSD